MEYMTIFGNTVQASFVAADEQINKNDCQVTKFLLLPYLDVWFKAVLSVL